MKRSLTLAIVEVSSITLVDSFITCENCYAFMKPVSFAVVLYDVTQRSSPQTVSENRTTFLSVCVCDLTNAADHISQNFL